jgi:very-short-patch-repair endonuclease
LNTYVSRQYGCINTRQLRAAGFDKNAVGRRVAKGTLVRMAPGVYAVPTAPPTWERQLSAALLSRPRAIVGGTSAAHLHGFGGFGPVRPVVIVPWSGNARSPIARVIRSEFFSSLATVVVRGFTTTTVAETILTLASTVELSRLKTVVDECLLTGRLHVADFEPVFERLIGARVAGSGRLRRVVEERQEAGREVEATYLERLLGRMLADPRVPFWVREHPFTLEGDARRVDAFIPSWSLVIEADSRRWHARYGDFEADRRRDNELARLGYQVLRFTYDMLKNSPETCLEAVLGAGAHRRASSTEK